MSGGSLVSICFFSPGPKSARYVGKRKLLIPGFVRSDPLIGPTRYVIDSFMSLMRSINAVTWIMWVWQMTPGGNTLS